MKFGDVISFYYDILHFLTLQFLLSNAKVTVKYNLAIDIFYSVCVNNTRTNDASDADDHRSTDDAAYHFCSLNISR